MRFRRRAGRTDRWSVLALLLALMLPLQTFAAAAHCDHAPATAQSIAPHEHCAEHAQHALSTPLTGSPQHTQQHHGCCANCCLAVLVFATFPWRTPRAAAPDSDLPAPRAPLTLALDRLDRPPRNLA